MSVTELRAGVRELESPLNRFADAGYSADAQACRMDRLLEELVRRGEEC